MNKKQIKIHNWLIKKPGYLKKSAQWLHKKMPNSIYGNSTFKDVEIALKHAKESEKKYLEKTKTIIETVEIPNIITSKKLDPNNVLVIADMHEPFCKKGYLEHCLNIQNKYKCGKVVLIGDEVDLCAVSQWEKDPDGFSAGTEAELAQQKMKLWYKAFPQAFVCIGNHTARPFRMAKANGIPKKFIKSYEDAWEAPKGWKWAENWELNGVLQTHGTGFSGANAAIRIASMHRQNTVIGHIHSEAGIQYNASKIDIVWGMQVGGALDDKSYAAYYAKDQLKKSIIGCGVVLNGEIPIYEHMRL